MGTSGAPVTVPSPPANVPLATGNRAWDRPAVVGTTFRKAGSIGTTDTVLALSGADASLGRLAGAGRLLHNPHLLVSPYATREAVASSRIERTQASLSEVPEANATGRMIPGLPARPGNSSTSASPTPSTSSGGSKGKGG